MHQRKLSTALSSALLTLALMGTCAQAAQVKLAWDPSLSTAVQGYKLHYGSSTGSYSTTVPVGLQTSYTLSGLTDGRLYYIVATAYDSTGRESAYSNEVTARVYDVPVAGFTASATSGQAPLPVTFTNTSTGTITAWNWQFGDGTGSTSQSPAHSYTAAGSYTVTLTVTGPGGSSTASRSITVSAPVPATLLSAHFNTGTDGFVYADNPFYSTQQPNYASGAYSNGALRVTLGGVDDTDITGMSGAWSRTFTVPGTTTVPVTLSFRYNLTQSTYYESDEYSDVVISVDAWTAAGYIPGRVARLTGDGDGGSTKTTGWQTYTTTMQLAPGSHLLRLGGYNNKKTAAREVTTILLDDVVVTMSASTLQAMLAPVASGIASPSMTRNQTSQTTDVDNTASHKRHHRSHVAASADTSAVTPSHSRRGAHAAASAHRLDAPEPDVNIWLEAEQGMLHSLMASGFDNEASDGQYIWASDGQDATADSSPDDSLVQYTFTVPRTDTYVVWGRVSSDAASTSAFVVAVEEPATASTQSAAVYTLEWTPLSDGETADAAHGQTWVWDQVASHAMPVFFLEAGEYMLTIKQWGSGTKMDQILITNNLEYRP
jgi:PKD repeat protein